MVACIYKAMLTIKLQAVGELISLFMVNTLSLLVGALLC